MEGPGCREPSPEIPQSGIAGLGPAGFHPIAQELVSLRDALFV
jgi:hypothetical protein